MLSCRRISSQPLAKESARRAFQICSISRISRILNKISLVKLMVAKELNSSSHMMPASKCTKQM